MRAAAIASLLLLAGADFQPGEIVVVRHHGELVEARVVRQDQYGVLVQHKDWQDHTFHDDPAVAPTEYRQPGELRHGPLAAPAPRSGSAGSGEAVRRPQPGGGVQGRAGSEGSARPAPSAPGAPARTGAPAPGGAPAASGVLPDGDYYCYTYHPRPVVAGVFTISGASYRTRTGATGRYRMNGDRIEWLGTPPLGFALGVLEETDPRAKVRMYIQAADVGNKWKAAVCSPREDAASPAGADTAGAFPAGSHVEMDFAGHWYGATVVRCSSGRCLLRYDDPKWKDEWVENARIRRR